MGELRVRKIQEFIKQEVSRIILQELKDPRLGFVTVTDARITGDLREATVYVSLFGSDEEKKNTLAALSKAQGYIRSEVGKRLGIQITSLLYQEVERNHAELKCFLQDPP